MNTIGRQLVLVGIAVALGAAILWGGFDSNSSNVGAGGSSPSPTATPEDTSTEEPTVVPALPTSNAADVSVLVANSTGTAGLAGGVAADLASSFGYTTPIPVDSTGEAISTTLVFHVPGAEGDARQIATALGLSAASVAPMPSSPPVADLAGAQILVLLGLDKVPAG